MNNRIQQILQYSQLSQKEFAAQTGISPASLSQILSGKQSATIKTVEAVHARFPELSLDWLLFGKGDMMQKQQLEGAASAEQKPHQPESVQAPAAETYIEPARRYDKNSDVKNADKRQRHITEIRVFYSDGTFESFSGNIK